MMKQKMKCVFSGTTATFATKHRHEKSQDSHRLQVVAAVAVPVVLELVGEANQLQFLSPNIFLFFF